MFHLNSSIHLKKIKFTILIEKKFNRPHSRIIYSLGRSYRRCPHLLSQGRIQSRAQRFFDKLLVSTLQRTIALAKMNRMPIFVGKNLKFDMTWAFTKFFDKDLIASEC